MINNNNSVVVFQGEHAVIQHSDGNQSVIKTSTPTSCTVFTLYNRTRKIAVLAHIDEYTSVRSTINKIELKLRKHFEATLTDGEFTGFIMGGTSDPYSIEKKKLSNTALAAASVNTYLIDTHGKPGEGPQITINAQDGSYLFHPGNQVNLTLEFWQQREYGEFNNLLDLKYGYGYGGAYIPDYESKTATRSESEFGELVLSPEERPQWIEIHKQRTNNLNKHVDAVRTALAPRKDAEKQIQDLIRDKFSRNKPLQSSLKNKNYNLMFRQSATDTKYFALFKLLFKYSSTLDVDFTSKGKQSGTIWNVIEKYKTDTYKDFLDMYTL
ncbi:MAG: hypothetical protein VX777_04340 [Chlamydiota bacterium]|nr:hypothetical protein [Chlamydiota bacterium]